MTIQGKHIVYVLCLTAWIASGLSLLSYLLFIVENGWDALGGGESAWLGIGGFIWAAATVIALITTVEVNPSIEIGRKAKTPRAEVLGE